MVFGVETGMDVGRRGQIRIGFAKEQCFKFGVKELWRAYPYFYITINTYYNKIYSKQ